MARLSASCIQRAAISVIEVGGGAAEGDHSPVNVRVPDGPTHVDGFMATDGFAVWTVSTERGARANTGMGTLTESAREVWRELLASPGSMFYVEPTGIGD